MLKPLVFKSLTFFKISSLIAKLALAGTTISTLATLFDTIEADVGTVIDAACVATYLITQNLPTRSYEKTRHIPPG